MLSVALQIPPLELQAGLRSTTEEGTTPRKFGERRAMARGWEIKAGTAGEVACIGIFDGSVDRTSSRACSRPSVCRDGGRDASNRASNTDGHSCITGTAGPRCLHGSRTISQRRSSRPYSRTEKTRSTT